MTKALLLEHMTWPELDEIKDKIELVIVPLGSTEQHGPNTTFATDTLRASAVAELVGEIYGERVLIGPTLPIGLSYHHMKFPGTITYSLETYIKMIRDICYSLNRHGFNKILFMSGHGGNKRPVQEYATEAKKEFDMDIFIIGTGGSLVRELSKAHGFTEFKGHACEVETSQMMLLAPEDVRYDKLEEAKWRPESKYREKGHAYDGGVFWDYREVTENGCLGDARLANLEFGKEMNDMVISKICEFIDHIII